MTFRYRPAPDASDSLHRVPNGSTALAVLTGRCSCLRLTRVYVRFAGFELINIYIYIYILTGN